VGVPYSVAENALRVAVEEIYQSEVRTHAVGIGRHGNSFGLHVVRNTAQILPLGATIGPPLLDVQNVPVTYHDRHADPEPHVKVPAAGPGSPTAASLVPEQRRHNPLVCGLQLENFDDDVRTGTIAGGHIIIGTLGCFVHLNAGGTALLSNNHVVAGENRGVRGTDRLMHPGTGAFLAADQVATLTDYIAITPSPANARPAAGNVNFNAVDAGIATLHGGVAFHQAYLPSRSLAAPHGHTTAAVGDHVYKVGRTTGLTRGTITAIGAVVGPIPYAPGACWFQGTLLIEGLHGTMFSDHGDSGSAIVKDGTGEVVGLLFAGNGTDTFACPIDEVLAALHCAIA
jgi:hypothetical protein